MKPATALLKCLAGLGALAALAFAGAAHAAPSKITCTISNPTTLSFVYGSLYNLASGSVTVSCNNSGATARTASYQLAASVSANASGTQRRAAGTINTTSFINYNLTSDPACTVPWNATSPNFDPTALYTTPSLSTAGVATDNHTFFYYVCIPAGQTTAPADTYTDTMTISFVNNTATGAGPVAWNPGTAFTLLSATLYGSCSFSTQPTPNSMTFNYVSFGGAASASITFAAKCTNLLPYTMSLDATSGTINGITYTLGLSATSAVGTGSPQSYTISGNVAGGQSGTCAAAICPGSQTHMVTITY